MNLSENFRVRVEQNQIFGNHDNNHLIFSFYHERFKFPIAVDFEQKYLYRSNFTEFDLRLQHTFGQASGLGIGTSYAAFNVKPKISGNVDVESGNRYFNTFLFYDFNTLDQKQFPAKGWKISSQIGHLYNQNPDPLFYDVAGEVGSIDTLSFDNYQQLRLKVEQYSRLSDRFSFITQFNTGINFNNNQAYLNYFNVGGINDFLRNQITFVGLGEYQALTNSVAALMLGLQYKPFNSLYTILRANVGVYDFAYEKLENLNTGNFLSGYALTVGYASGFGPIQLSAMYNDQSRDFAGYVNIGFHF